MRGGPGRIDFPRGLGELPTPLNHCAELLLLLQELDVDASRLVLYERYRCAAPSVRIFDERRAMARLQRQMTRFPLVRRGQTVGRRNHNLVRVELLLTHGGPHQ